MRLRLDLDDLTADALHREAAANMRPLQWQAEWILREGLGTAEAIAARVRAVDPPLQDEGAREEVLDGRP